MLRTLSVCTLLALIATPAFGHGGIYRPPADAGSPYAAGGGRNGPPSTPGGVDRAGPGASSSSGGVPTTRGGHQRGTHQRGNGTSVTGGGESLAANGVWEYWWDHNKAEFLDVRSRLTGGSAVSGFNRYLSGKGRFSGSLPTRGVTPEMVATEIIPMLNELLEESDERDLLDSAVLAMARSARDDQVDQVLVAAQALLAHPQLSVQSSATLSLGVLGSPRAVPVLQDLAVATSAGRSLAGGQAVPDLTRELAALSLGMIGTPEVVPILSDLAAHTPDTHRNLRACAVVGLGLCEESAGPETVDLLIRMLGDRKVDPVVKSFVPTSLGKLGDPRALPHLLQAFTDRDTHVFVTESIAIALGRLGTIGDAETIAALQACYQEAGDMSARQFALMSLARIAARKEVPEDARDAHDALMAWMAGQVSRPARQTDRAWAALAAGIAARHHEQKQVLVIDRLAAGYEDASDPSVKSAFALALGLLESRAHGATILEDLNTVGDTRFKGYAAVGLGLINHGEAKNRMREMCGNRNLVPSLRLQIATGLALMRDRDTVPMLVATLDDAETLGLVAAVAQSLGMIGDADALHPLKETLADTDRPPLTRAFAAVSLGLLADRSRLPWHAAIRTDNNYLIDIPPMSEVFDIP
ncbi:MAG: HEAT repeat domain-containing protein [Planctomycetota bacterium]|jgi:HEAT repeat protein